MGSRVFFVLFHPRGAYAPFERRRSCGMKKKPFYIITAILCVCIVFFALRMIKTANREKTGAAIVRVRDGFRGAPVENARVTLLRTGRRFLTAADGSTERIAVPILRDANADLARSLRGGWDEAALFIRADGYVDTLVLHVAVRENETREITVDLFQTSDVPGQDVVVIGDAPPEEWIERVQKRFS